MTIRRHCGQAMVPIVVTPDDEWLEYGNDQKAKRALTTVMFFFTLAETENAERLSLGNILAQQGNL